MPPPPNLLRDLHRIHQQLSDLHDRQMRGPKQVQARRTNVAQLEQGLKETNEKTKYARVAADEKQLQLKSGEDKITELRRKLNEAASNREYQALLEQIAADEMANSVLEDEILEALGEIDDYQAAGVDARQLLDRGREELAKIEARLTEEAVLIQGDVTRLEAELKSSESRLLSEIRDVYYRVMASKGSDGMALVEGEYCGGCYQQIPPNSINRLYLKQPVLCNNCGRLLYLPEDRAPGKG